MRILAINPGMISTKVGIFQDEELLMHATLNHPFEELCRYPFIMDEFDYRKEKVLEEIQRQGYTMDFAVSVAPGVFADIPLLFGLSYHPELTFEKYAANGSLSSETALYSDVAYNVTSLSLPQMLRYTSITRPSRLLPYYELGAQASFNLRRSMDYRYFHRDLLSYLDYRRNINFLKEEVGEESIPAISFAVLAGFGVEWQYSRYHSLYFSGRFICELGSVGRIGGMLQVAYNL